MYFHFQPQNLTNYFIITYYFRFGSFHWTKSPSLIHLRWKSLLRSVLLRCCLVFFSASVTTCKSTYPHTIQTHTHTHTHIPTYIHPFISLHFLHIQKANIQVKRINAYKQLFHLHPFIHQSIVFPVRPF